ncbi:MAG: LOG family protein [Calditrichia bacterium]
MGLKAEKAYKNQKFLSSSDARTLRILAEYLEPNARFRDLNIKDTIVFYGSARVVDGERARREYEACKQRLESFPTEENRRAFHRSEVQLKMSRFYDEARELARLLTEWSQSIENSHHRFIVCSGGGPGVMEAVNRGASDVPGGKSIGMNISIPMEQDSNDYITPELNFEFHYFFMRKFWFVYLAKALVIFPGGFGTMDELWEVLTLIQTKKIQKKMPVVLYGREYWNNVVNFQYMVDNLVIDESDLKLFKIVDDPREAFEYLSSYLAEVFL